MGMCCSYLDNAPYCKKCGCPYTYYKNYEHASRRSCRVYHNNSNIAHFEYHLWNDKIG
ncbi:hypothetical protein OAA43_00640 [bacterium]|nr:hypothetical protein [bacterium]